MRRSAAPSQIGPNKKPISRVSVFVPPFKRPCLSDISSNSNNNTKIRIDSQHKSKIEVSIHKESKNEHLQHETKSIIPPSRTSSDLLSTLLSNQTMIKCKSENGYVHNITENVISQNELRVEHMPIVHEHDTKFQQKSLLCSDEVKDISSTACNTRYFSVVWCKLSKKKHKRWEGDAVLIVKSRSVTLKDMEGKIICSGTGYKLQDLCSLEEGNTLAVGSKEIEIQGSISEEQFVSGKCFQSCVITTEEESKSPPVPKIKFKPFCLPTRGDSNIKRNPSMKSLYDASKPDAIVMPRPPCGHQFRYNKQLLPVTDVVIDPHIGSKLRPHQRAGVIFLYECVMGFRVQDYQGAILADEMGLGKTLQCITLIWTLFKQGPYGCSPTLKKVLIVTPSSICANWGKEFNKWLTNQRCRPFIVDQQNKVEDYFKQNIYPILIISYEMVIRNIELINRGSFDLLLCDEGHRLKNIAIKTTSLLTKINVKKRIIATGTPVQNDLQELFALVEFVNPGMLGSSLMFKRVYEEPIIRSQQPTATNEEKLLGECRAAELNKISSRFTIRRTQEIINKYLPPKSEYVVFCRPTESQSDLYKAVSTSRGLQRILSDSETGDHLSAICILRKLCNHPALLSAYEHKEHLSDIQAEITKLLPQNLTTDTYLEEDSGKLAVISCLLWSLSEAKREKIVIVSNFTTTLDMLQQLCQRYSYLFLRLDGGTPTSKRQSLVDRFNSPSSPELVFLLSAKAGGVGLNLIGASRIVLFDIDWNPATDLQAMARVWRDGQKKEVFIYRLLLSGSIEEKMFQRQVSKQGISGCVVDARINSKVKFSVEELKDLFQFYEDASCLTHDLLSCQCDQKGGGTTDILEGGNNSSPAEERDCRLISDEKKKENVTMDQLHTWQHFLLPEGTELLRDSALESAADFINFVFKSSSC